ncbi:BppU family phage baseplate upper protein [Vagococcus salmoninarum]|uniref:BppU family phage baseplate upper protein n=1 Tax=Vagococcus salmoninarum TaxID=2739 RepID=UPI001882D6A8|nr:BppU family phage baseplate upper protein [Vagococcus salmoninarum]MBE9390327.1 BppU family phage baseplate upper protein [Vagococcus salmoninarum]
MNKETSRKIMLDPFFAGIKDSKLVVWSHDSNSFKIDMEISSNACPLPLNGATPRILLQFKPDDQIRIYPLKIESEHQGILSFLIPEEILGFEGEVYAHIYVDFESKSHDLGSFKFCMKQSVIDSEIKELDTLYIKEFTELVDKIKQQIIDYEREHATLIGNSTREFNEFLKTSQKKIDDMLNSDVKLDTTIFREYERNNNHYVSQLHSKIGEVDNLANSLNNEMGRVVEKVGTLPTQSDLNALKSVATVTENGLMSNVDKVKLDSLAKDEEVILYDGMDTNLGIYFSADQRYTIDKNKELVELKIVFSRYAVGEGPRNYAEREVRYSGSTVRGWQKMKHQAREPLIWGVGTNNVCFKDVMFDDSGVFGAESNAQIPAGNTIDNRLMCVRKIVAVYKKGI